MTTKPLLILAVWLLGGWFAVNSCHGAVAVVANRTQTSVTFQVYHDQELVSQHTLSPGQIVPLRMREPTTLRVSDSTGSSRYLLSPDAAFCFFADESRHLDLRQLDLGDGAPTVPNPAAKEIQAALTDSAPVVPVRILVDKRQSAGGETNWVRQELAQFNRAAGLIESHCKVRFDVTEISDWEPNETAVDFNSLRQEFRSRVPLEGAWLAIGFTDRLPIDRGDVQLHDLAPLSSHILIREWSDSTTELERVELIAHALGKFLGGFESREPNSLMRPMQGDGLPQMADSQLNLDIANALVLNLVADQVLARSTNPLRELPAGLQSRLHTIQKSATVAAEQFVSEAKTPTMKRERQKRNRGMEREGSRSSKPSREDRKARKTDSKMEAGAGTRNSALAELTFPPALMSEDSRSPSLDANESSEVLIELINREIESSLSARGVSALESANDAQFLRRATLDVLGRLPTHHEVDEYLSSKAPDKKTKLVDRLLADTGFGSRLADQWMPLLFDSSVVDSISSDPLRWWLENQFNRNAPWDSMVRQLVAAEGPQDVNPAVTMFMGGTRATLSPAQATTIISRGFLGVQLQCAQCHDHPFADWKQSQFWEMAGYFRYIESKSKWPESVRAAAIPTVGKRAANGMRFAPRGIVDSMEPLPINKLDGALELAPRLPSGGILPVPAGSSPRREFAYWLTAPENPWFARAMVNRLWAQYFGRGLANPVDDLTLNSNDTNQEILSVLANEFSASQFNVKRLVRSILLCDAYSRVGIERQEHGVGDLSYDAMPIRVMDAHQLFDSLTAILGEPAMAGKSPIPIRLERGPRERFVQHFSGEGDPTQLDRGLLQMLQLMNDPLYEHAIATRIEQAAKSNRPTATVVQELYRMTLSRDPSPAESSIAVNYIEQAENEPAAHADLLWALLLSSEFISIP